MMTKLFHKDPIIWSLLCSNSPKQKLGNGQRFEKESLLEIGGTLGIIFSTLNATAVVILFSNMG